MESTASLSRRKPTWGLVCGVVRDESGFLAILSDLFELLNQGYLDGITVSTWTTENPSTRKLFKSLRNSGINVVESVDPGSDAFRSGGFRTNNFVRQITQLRRGLNSCPESHYVLKTRTDKTRLSTLDRGIFFYPDDITGNSRTLTFSRRVVIEYGQVLSPGNIGDMNYFGTWVDLFNLCTVDLTPELEYSKTIDGFDPFLNEDRILLNILERYDRRFSIYFEVTNTYQFRIDRFSLNEGNYWACADKISDLQIESEAFLSVMALWWRFIYQNLSIGLRVSESNQAVHLLTQSLRGADFMNIMSPKACHLLGLLKATSGSDHQCIVFNSAAWLNALYEGTLTNVPLFVRDILFGKDVDVRWLRQGLLDYADKLTAMVREYVGGSSA